jgi:sugar lactone lactonase YvrE
VPAERAAVAAVSFGGATVEKLADGFYAAGGGAVGADGTLYFIDRKPSRIYSWSEGRKLGIVRDQPLDPVNLAVDRSGNLLVLASAGRDGTVYSLKPGSPDTELTMVPATAAARHAGAATVLPVNWWNNGEFKDQLNTSTMQFTTLAEMFARDIAVPKPREHVSPDGSLVLPAFRVVQQGPPDFRAMRFSDSLDTYGFVTAKPGEQVLITNASENKTYRGRVGAGGAVTDLKVFADRGGEGVVSDAQGRVYVANGQVFVYAPDGKEIGRIDVPERPLQLLFGGTDRKTLFILTHHALYAAKLG